MRFWLCSFALAFACCGCEREVIDHTRQRAAAGAGGVEGGPPAGTDCATLDDGEPCDDLSVCTPRSVCRDGACFGENPMTSCVVADTEGDYGDPTALAGWSYGYWDVGVDVDGHFDADDFRPMEFCGSGTWKPAGRCTEQAGQPGYRWTSILCCGLQHPEAVPSLELPVRRWTSDVSGPARVHVAHRMTVGMGDGTRAVLMVEGETVWTHDHFIPSSEAIQVEADVDVNLEVGTRVEQLVHPHESDAEDTTYYVIQIEGR